MEAAAVEGLVQREELLHDVIAHQQRKDLGDVALLREQEIQLFPTPRHVSATIICS